MSNYFGFPAHVLHGTPLPATDSVQHVVVRAYTGGPLPSQQHATGQNPLPVVQQWKREDTRLSSTASVRQVSVNVLLTPEERAAIARRMGHNTSPERGTRLEEGRMDVNHGDQRRTAGTRWI